MTEGNTGERKPPLPPDIEELHGTVCGRGEETYDDPATGYTVFTAVFHKKRGYCCGNRCRHCPYEWQHVGDPQAVRRAAAAAKKERAQKNGKGAVVEMNGGDGVDGASTVQQGEADPLPTRTGCVTMMGGGGSGALLLGRHRGVGLTARPIEAAAARAFVGAPSAVLAWVGKGGARAQLLAAGATSLVAALGSGDYSL